MEEREARHRVACARGQRQRRRNTVRRRARHAQPGFRSRQSNEIGACLLLAPQGDALLRDRLVQRRLGSVPKDEISEHELELTPRQRSRRRSDRLIRVLEVRKSAPNRVRNEEAVGEVGNGVLVDEGRGLENRIPDVLAQAADRCRDGLRRTGAGDFEGEAVIRHALWPVEDLREVCERRSGGEPRRHEHGESQLLLRRRAVRKKDERQCLRGHVCRSFLRRTPLRMRTNWSRRSPRRPEDRRRCSRSCAPPTAARRC